MCVIQHLLKNEQIKKKAPSVMFIDIEYTAIQRSATTLPPPGGLRGSACAKF